MWLCIQLECQLLALSIICCACTKVVADWSEADIVEICGARAKLNELPLTAEVWK